MVTACCTGGRGGDVACRDRGETNGEELVLPKGDMAGLLIPSLLTDAANSSSELLGVAECKFEDHNASWVACRASLRWPF